jgi:glycine betaine/proline transport system ATP-binding protein
VLPIAANEPVSGLFGQIAQTPYSVPVVADDGCLRGVISKTTLLKFLDRDTPPVPAHAA